MAGCGTVFGGEIAGGDSAKGGSGFFGWDGCAELLWEAGGVEGVHVKVEDLANAIGLNVFIENILDDATAAHAGFQAHDFAAAVVGAAIGNSDVADATGGFAA